jgi:hypothetical protein
MVIFTFLTPFILTIAAESAPRKMPPPPKRAVAKEFRDLIKKNHREFDRCGLAEVERTKRKFKGIVLIRYIVNGDGKVTESGPVHNTTKSRFVADCLVRNLERLSFPATFGPPVTSSYTFKFDLKK